MTIGTLWKDRNEVPRKREEKVGVHIIIDKLIIP